MGAARGPGGLLGGGQQERTTSDTPRHAGVWDHCGGLSVLSTAGRAQRHVSWHGLRLFYHGRRLLPTRAATGGRPYLV